MEDQDSEKLKNETGFIGPASDNIHDFKKVEVEFSGDTGTKFDQDAEIPEEIPVLLDPAALNIQEAQVTGNSIDPLEPVAENSTPEKDRKSFSKTFLGRLLFGMIFLILLFLSVFVFPAMLQNTAISVSLLYADIISTNSEAEMAEDKSILESSIGKLDMQLKAYVPDSYYMIINSTNNEFSLMKAGALVRHGQCSTGSYTVLEDEKKGKKYTFITPKGRRKVLSKVTDPIWTKPNWAFIEEGLPVPSASDPSRFEEGVLGDYALKLGDGYMIHGTIWQRYLGLPVTHGCVRLNDADLEVVFNSLNKGSYVFIY